jgi:hypothetical protein
MTDTTVVSTTSPIEPSNRRQLDKLIFDQNLDEVHLLIDFISGRADRSIATLAIPSKEDPNKPMTAREVIEAIAEMRYPPPEKQPSANAKDAAILLLAKDRLSALAAPARGLTIAYTAMFINAETRTLPKRLWDLISGRIRAGEKPAEPQPAEQQHPDTRVDLSVGAFPILRSHARRFRRWRDSMAVFALVWLMLTSLAYWDAGLGRASLEQLDQNWKSIIDELKDNPALLHCNDKPAAGPAKTDGDSKGADDALRLELACGRHQYHQWMAQTALHDVQGIFHCGGMGWLGQGLHVWCWNWLLSGAEQTIHQTAADASTPGGLADRAKNATYWQTATSMLSVFTAYILPMMFALLGTLIAAFRFILNRVRDSELAPRDFVRMVLGIPTGLVAGVAVGLFLSPSSVPVQGTGGLAGQLTLTASGLGFIAGYASQSFFAYLDNVVGSVFPNTSQSNIPAVHPPNPNPSPSPSPNPNPNPNPNPG